MKRFFRKVKYVFKRPEWMLDRHKELIGILNEPFKEENRKKRLDAIDEMFDILEVCLWKIRHNPDMVKNIRLRMEEVTNSIKEQM
jgi:hypothetical protein